MNSPGNLPGNSPGNPASGVDNHHDRSPSQQGGGHPPRYRRVVIKAGTSVLTGGSNGDYLDLAVMADLAGQISELRRSMSVEILLVSSGAIAAGREALGKDGNSHHGRNILNRQVLAALGQGRLMHQYQQLFAEHQVQVAQTLLTINDLSDRQSYLNVRNTLLGLLELGVVPILNENDVVAVDEIGEVFGDNDRLSALVATLVDADLLVILTDIDGLYTSDPSTNPDATLIPLVEQVNSEIESAAGKHLNPGARGGMPTKIEAARLVTTSGIPMIICDGRDKGAVLRAAQGQSIGTRFQPAAEKLEARKRWMLSRVRDSGWGEILVDPGAAQALLERNVSLLPAGVKGVKGEFQRGDILYITDPEGKHIACGIANYASSDISSIKGFRSDRIPHLLGYFYGQEVVHRNNLVLL